MCVVCVSEQAGMFSELVVTRHALSGCGLSKDLKDTDSQTLWSVVVLWS